MLKNVDTHEHEGARSWSICVPNQECGAFRDLFKREFIFRCEQKDRFELVIFAVDRPDVGCWAMMP